MSYNHPLRLRFSIDYPSDDGGIARICAEIVNGLVRRDACTILIQGSDGDSTVPAGAVEDRFTSRRPFRELPAWWTLVRGRHFGSVIAVSWYPEDLIALIAGKSDLVILAHSAKFTRAE